MLIVIEDQIFSLSWPFSAKRVFKCGFFTLKDPDKVFCVKLLAAIGSIPGEAPPQITEIEAVVVSNPVPTVTPFVSVFPIDA